MRINAARVFVRPPGVGSWTSLPVTLGAPSRALTVGPVSVSWSRSTPRAHPDSGTAGRLLSNITTPNGLLSTLLGAGAALPLSAVYSKTGSKVINSAVNKGAIPARNALQRLLADNPNISRNVGSSTLAELVRN